MNPMNFIGYLLQHVSGVLAKQADQVLQEQLGLGFSQFKILMALQWNPRTQQRQIAEALGQTEASISRQIKLMFDKGLLITQVSPENRREHITTPTQKGIKLTEAAREVLVRNSAPMFDALSAKEKDQMIAMLQKMHDKICQPGRLGACDHPTNVAQKA